MPELPEVETIRAALAPVLTGRRVVRVSIDDARLTRPEPPARVRAALEGERVASVGRRGKYLVVVFESGRRLLVHLRMTGSFRTGRNGALDGDPHRRAVLGLDDGTEVAYRDVRRFGTWAVLDPPAAEAYLDGRLGPEPLDRSFTAARLARALAGRRAPVKAAFLDQRTVAGVGNIYADEALWRAGIHPRTPADALRPEEVAMLRRAIRAALRTGIRRQGATLRDYRGPGGDPGAMQDAFAVYGRDGEPCFRCGLQVEKIRVAGRGTWLCPSCQPFGGPA